MFKQLADDAQAPSGVRARAAEMLAALAPAVPASSAPGQNATPAAAPAPDKVPTPSPQDKK